MTIKNKLHLNPEYAKYADFRKDLFWAEQEASKRVMREGTREAVGCLLAVYDAKEAVNEILAGIVASQK